MFFASCTVSFHRSLFCYNVFISSRVGCDRSADLQQSASFLCIFGLDPSSVGLRISQLGRMCSLRKEHLLPYLKRALGSSLTIESRPCEVRWPVPFLPAIYPNFGPGTHLLVRGKRNRRSLSIGTRFLNNINCFIDTKLFVNLALQA